MSNFVEDANEVAEQAKRKFKSFTAGIDDHGDTAIISWKRQDDYKYSMRYLIDKKGGTVTVTGDLGEGIMRWWHPISLKFLMKSTSDIYQIMDTAQYRIMVSSVPDYVVRREDVIKEMKEGMYSDEIKKALEKTETKMEEIAGIIESDSYGRNCLEEEEYEDLMKFNRKLYETCQMSYMDIGRRIQPKHIYWCVGLNMALNDLKEGVTKVLKRIEERRKRNGDKDEWPRLIYDRTGEERSE